MKGNSSKQLPENSPKPALVGGLAFELLGLYIICIAGGYKLDKYVQNFTPWFTIVGLILAVVGTFYLLVKFVKK